MICYAKLITEEYGATAKFYYRCTIPNVWTSDLAVEDTLARDEFGLEVFIYKQLATQVSTQASADTNTSIVVTESEIIIPPG